MMTRLLCLAIVLSVPAAGVRAQDNPPARPEDLAAVVEAVRLSLVPVEFTLQTHHGQMPAAPGWYSGWGSRYLADLETVIDQQRPCLAPGFVLSPTEVLTPDPMIHPRFVQRIAVRVGDRLIEAAPAAWGLHEAALVLKLDEPIDEARVLHFDAAAEGALYSVGYMPADADMPISVRSLPGGLSVTHDGRPLRPVPPMSLITVADGTPVGMSMNGLLPLDDTWRGCPLQWPMIAAADLDAAADRLRAAFDRSFGRVALSLRSPKKGTDDRSAYGRRGGDEAATEINTMGVLIDGRRLLVLAALEPKTTARLERIRFFRGGAPPLAAQFAGTLKDYGALLGAVDGAADGAVAADEAPITDWRDRLLLAVEVQQQGEEVTTYFSHRRITGYDVGFRGRQFPSVRGDTEGLLLFDTDGELVAFPALRRRKADPDTRWRRDDPILTPASHFTALLQGDLAAHLDGGNVPLAEDQEARLAWLGVELQPLDAELARINKVSHLTRDGDFGAMVSYVYPDSPAASAGVQAGDILIRVHAADLPRPIEVTSTALPWGGDRPFPWDRWDELPEQYFDQVPRPWPPAESTLNRALTDLGFGTAFEAEFARDGEPVRRAFTVTQSPQHYDMAAKFDAEPLGMTVRDMTYEVRRYFLRRPSDPGVIVSTIKPGSRASVSGMKPFEIITHVNGQPVLTAADFERLAAGGGELQFNVLRMTKSRVVRLRAAGEPDAEVTATQPAP